MFYQPKIKLFNKNAAAILIEKWPESRTDDNIQPPELRFWNIRQMS